MKQTTIAIFHNFMDNIGGAEMVTLSLARELDAPIYTTNIDRKKIAAMGFSDVSIISIGSIPKKAPFRHQYALYKFRRLHLGRTYDQYIISGDWAMSAAVNHHPNLWYVHSPLNELWAFKDYIRTHLLSWWKRPLFDVWVVVNRYLNLRYLAAVDSLICNSTNTQQRVVRYYDRDAHVIHPPVDTTLFFNEKPQGYWLSVNRLIPHKRIELQLDAFRALPHERLIIVGSYERGAAQFEAYRRHLERIKPPNVTILHWVDSAELRRLYAACNGVIATARDEDFGMSVIEAMAAGKPVIAAREGGYTESVVHGTTGYLIANITSAKLARAITTLPRDLNPYSRSFIARVQNRAYKYDIAAFTKQIRAHLH